MRWKSILMPACLLLALALAGCGPSQSKTAAKVKPQAIAPPVQAPPAPQAAAAPKPQLSAAKQQRVQQLIAQVNAAYAAGAADYRQGNLLEAKAQFDRAVDLMLSSGIDIKGTPELDAEYQRIVDKVSNLEMEALKQGNGFVSNVEPSPADVANDVTFKVNPKVMAKAQADLATTKSDLPLVVNQYVAAFINFFAYTKKGHNTLLHAFERAGMYKGMIKRILAEEGVPQDLIYLAVAESGFQPRAVNWRSGAGGMWQFMPHGKYGLTRNRYVDERFDPEESTLAYARYMKFLHDQLGDWYLAMAAYDWGAGNVQRAVAKTGYADFWQLYQRRELPTETRNYVPEILAAIIIANHPKQYGFDDITLAPPVLTDTVTINYSVNLRLVSDLVGAPVTELEALNPSLLRTVTPPRTSFDLHLPAGTATLYNQLIAQIPEDKRDSWRYHAVKAADTMASVARRYHVSEASLASANQMRESDSLADVTGLVVPVRYINAAFVGGRVYRVRSGDTLGGIARRFGVSVNQLRVWNGIHGSLIRAGHRLYVAGPERERVRSTSRREEHEAAGGARVYTVRNGDTLGGIARRFGVSVNDLRVWNGIHGSMIRVGHRLYVAAPERARVGSTSRREEHEAAAGARVYTVRSGDTLDAIAGRFGVSISDLQRWNGIHGSMIRPGHRLYVAAPQRERVGSASRREEDKAVRGARVYTVHSGDTLDAIAGRFGVSISDLQRWNGIHGSMIQAGHRLYVADPARAPGRGELALHKETGADSADPAPAPQQDAAAAGK